MSAKPKPIEYKMVGECWEVTSHTGGNGYGHVRKKINGKSVYIHRIIFEEVYGPIPQGMHVLHHCDNPKCINPDHLFLGTILDNNRDMAQKGRSLQGKKHHNVKLTEEQVKEIRGSEESNKRLALRYGVSEVNIYYIKTKKRWAWL